jgi:3-oxoacyl-ACP reductase-like protein
MEPSSVRNQIVVDAIAIVAIKIYHPTEVCNNCTILKNGKITEDEGVSSTTAQANGGSSAVPESSTAAEAAESSTAATATISSTERNVVNSRRG